MVWNKNKQILFTTSCTTKHGRHLGFDVIRNSAIRSADPEIHTLEPNMKCIGSPVAIRVFWGHTESHLGAKGGRGVSDGTVRNGDGGLYRLSIVTVALSVTIRPQFAIECLRRSNQQGGESLWANISGCSPWSRPMMVGSAESEHPGLTKGEIISEEFQPMWSPSTNVTDRQTDGLDWIVQCFTSPPTQYRLYGRRFLQVKRPNQQYQSTEGKYRKENNPENKENTKYTRIHTKW